MTVTAITSLDRFKQIINSGNVVLIDFWATWCGPCRFISPIFEKLSETIPGAEYYKVDVDDQEAVSQEVGIKAMPTFIAYKNGEKIGELVGADQAGLQKLITESIAK